MENHSRILGLDMGREHAPLLEFEFPRFLSESARVATPTDAAISKATTFDSIPSPNLLTSTNLDDPSNTEAGSEETMKPAISSARVTSFWMRITLCFEMLEAGLILSVDDAGAPCGDDACLTECQRGGGYTKNNNS